MSQGDVMKQTESLLLQGFPEFPGAACDALKHGPAGPSEYVPGRGWVRACICGREFESHEAWQHVPRLFDHIATAGRT